MRRFFRSLKRRWLEMSNARTVTIDQITVVAEKDAIPPMVRDLLLRNTYEDQERKLMLRVLKPGMRVLEVGTGIGLVSLLAARVAGQENVFCYEANPALEPLIRRNYALNGLQPTLTMKAVTVDGQPVSFFQNDNIISSSLIDRKQESRKVTVESVAFEELLGKHDPEVLVMDVEGAEVDILGHSQLGNIRHIVIELHPHIVGQDKVDALEAHLAAIGFSVEDRDRKTAYFRRSA